MTDKPSKTRGKSMRMRDFIKKHRKEIDECIHSVPGMEDYRLNDKEREEWIKNDEGLYLWAKEEGVPI